MIPDVSIITGAYNSMPYITRMLQSVFQQTIGLDRLEFIAVDDGSTDGTGEELDEFAKRWPAMRVIHQPNCGPSKARNVGLDHARGRYVFILDADDYLGPEALERMVRVADEQESDIVLGKMVGVGGRHAPQSMFTETQLKTTVFDSRVNWTYNPMKLIRRELIEGLGLRFIEGMHYAEDQPFIMTAYFNARVITVLADYDYVYWVQRSDGGNITQPYQPIDRALLSLRTMLALIAEHTEPGPARDRLLRRHFTSDMDTMLRSIAAQPDRSLQESAFAEVRGWAAEYYNECIGENIGLFWRVAYRLIEQGLLDELLEVVRFHSEGTPQRRIVSGKRVYADFPVFRNPHAGVPDEWFDVTDRVGMTRYLKSADWDGGALVVHGHAFVRGVPSSETEVTIVLRERGTGEEHALPVTEETTPTLTEEYGGGVIDYGSAGFLARIDLGTAGNGSSLGDGLWDVYVRCRIDEFTLENRLGRHRSEDVDTSLRPRVVAMSSDRAPIVTSYYTQPYGNLTLDVGGLKHRVERILTITGADWAPRRPAAVAVHGQSDVIGLPAGCVRIVLSSVPTDEVHEIAAVSDDSTVPPTFEANVELATAAHGRALPHGTWTVRVHVDVGDRHEVADIPLADDELVSVRWWRFLRPARARLTENDDGVLVLHSWPADARRALSRRIDRFLGAKKATSLRK